MMCTSNSTAETRSRVHHHQKLNLTLLTQTLPCINSSTEHAWARSLSNILKYSGYMRPWQSLYTDQDTLRINHIVMISMGFDIHRRRWNRSCVQPMVKIRSINRVLLFLSTHFFSNPLAALFRRAIFYYSSCTSVTMGTMSYVMSHVPLSVVTYYARVSDREKSRTNTRTSPYIQWVSALLPLAIQGRDLTTNWFSSSITEHVDVMVIRGAEIGRTTQA